MWFAKGLAIGLGEGQDGVITQAQLLADSVISIRDRLQALNREYEIAKIIQGENSDSAQKLREQIAELAQQYDALSGSVVKADESQKKWAGTLGMINTLVAAFTGTKKSGGGGRSTPGAGEDWGFDYSGPAPGSAESGITAWGAKGPELPSYDVGGIVPGLSVCRSWLSSMVEKRLSAWPECIRWQNGHTDQPGWAYSDSGVTAVYAGRAC